MSDVGKQTQSAANGRHLSQQSVFRPVHTCLTHFLWQQPLALVVASAVPQEGTEEVAEAQRHL